MELAPVTRYAATLFFSDEVSGLTTATISSLAQIIDGDHAAWPALSNDKAGLAIVSRAGLIVGVTGSEVRLEYSPVEGQPTPRFMDFMEKAALVAECFDAKTPERRATRLSVLQEGMLLPSDEAPMNAAANGLLRFPSVLGTPKGAPWEWNWRCVASDDRTFGGTTETLNLICEIKRASGTITSALNPTFRQSFDRLHRQFDINTRAERTEPRFSYRDGASFFRATVRWIDELDTALNPFVGGQHGA